MSRALWAAVSLGLVAVGCGGDPAGPNPAVGITSLRLSSWHAVLAPGEEITLTATGRTAQGATVSTTVDWSSNAPSIATVSPDGRLTAISVGHAAITASTGSTSASLEVDVAPPGLGRLVDSVRRAAGLPAMGAAIITESGTEAIAVAGTRRASGGALVGIDDKWHIGSNLKAITAALAAIAVGDGAIAWSSTIADRFPDLAAQTRAAYRDVTLADLLSHTGGIRNDPPLAAFFGATAQAQRNSVVSWALGELPAGPVGGFYYSNPGYVLAGVMVERAYQGDFERLLTDRLLAPLGASGLGWGSAAAPGASDQPVGHTLEGSQWRPCEGCDNPPGLGPAGRAHIPLGSWARVIRELILADAGRSTIIPASEGRTLFTSRVAIPDTDGYGLGWVLVTRGWAGGRAAAHEGSNGINHSVAWLALGRGLGFIAATNAADLSTGITGRALDGLIGRMIRFHDSGQ